MEVLSQSLERLWNEGKELEVPIVSSIRSLDEMYVGTGARKIRNLFKEVNTLAKNSEHNACILFIDEGQNLLRTRGRSGA